MNKSPQLFIGETSLKSEEKKVNGTYTEIQGEKFYKINNYDQMKPFFMSITSSGDHWMFISSKGGLTAGRINPENALFPYYTDDKIHDSSGRTGPKTIVTINKDSKTFLWEPFNELLEGVYDLERNIYKNIPGNKIIFEEVNKSLNVSFSYEWLNSDEFGFIRKSNLKNHSNVKLDVSILDGLLNILPYGVNKMIQTDKSTLVDGYKKCELDLESKLGLFLLSSILTDRAEPSEALKANTVWSAGLNNPTVLLSTNQLANFRKGISVETEDELKGQRGAYLLNATFEINPGEENKWYIIADLSKGPSDVIRLKEEIVTNTRVISNIEKSVHSGTERLIQLVAKSDGIQHSDDLLNTNRHFSNVLFNIMRGGIFDFDYQIPMKDFKSFVRTWNKNVYNEFETLLNQDKTLSYKDFDNEIASTGSVDLIRLSKEYLPLTFSRRHGDPSRPWNNFSIDIKKENGEPNLDFQGNWRDIFQNWEALALSFPLFTENMITKFLNASTEDGYNPYRITREGVDWEVFDPEDPWSNIGYWGDHQIIYLLKLLEIYKDHYPNALHRLLNENRYVYANVPYKIKPYSDIIDDPYDTIIFNDSLAGKIDERTEKLGTDGKLVMSEGDSIVYVSMMEKLLVPVLSKLSNFIPDGGIWMNTQRPEWNDANNALVGYGLSMVTVYYLRRHLTYLIELLSNHSDSDIGLRQNVDSFIDGLNKVFKEFETQLDAGFNDESRKNFVDALGEAGTSYRETLYSEYAENNRIKASKEDVISFLKTSLKYIDETIRNSKRSDGMFHSYNLIRYNNEGMNILHLQEMLEGQVAILSSGLLTVQESIALLKNLRESNLYRSDQHSYMLYPNKDLKKFLDKNIIPESDINKNKLLLALLKDGNTDLLEKDIKGKYHFSGKFRNSKDVKATLSDLSQNGYDELTKEFGQITIELFEDLFDHKSFTGRSGSFFKYEGLGSIYWHMVSKLGLSVRETYEKALESENDSKHEAEELELLYQEIKKGIGVHKSPEKYGAFPTDPYSHTPSFTGVQQPGMTGQVKEDIINRWSELGVSVKNGCIQFNPTLVNKSEFLTKPRTIAYYREDKNKETIQLSSDSLFFTYCGIPVIYIKKDKSSIDIYDKDDQVTKFHSYKLNNEISEKIFHRSPEIKKITVAFE